ncbi:Glutamine--tRNA ligase [Chromobacterium violaceum]|uniref:Glutamine--tRNA ligase n=1 Tax=Chromobacterium violaceum TaxID=536 RepID=A0A447TAW7_CHRVL|nr:Glutamine--tRNA ligase [Chromobacterium violaceum]
MRAANPVIGENAGKIGYNARFAIHTHSQNMSTENNAPVVNNFIRSIIDEDLATGRRSSVVTRFPPEPNGFAHIGHAKAICINFGLAEDYNGQCNLRMDDTNPEKESDEFVEAFKQDISWLGFKWNGEVRYASDYFDRLYDYAVELIQAGKAYVDDLSAEEMRQYRGNLTEPGKNSPTATARRKRTWTCSPA